MKAINLPVVLFFLVSATSCDADQRAPVVDIDKPKPASVPAKKAELGKNVYLEIQGSQRRVRINSYVCLRQGLLEQFLTRKGTKEHEAILAADVDARLVHAALVSTGAEPGSPVKYVPKYQPARGTRIKIYLEYSDKGKPKRVPAQHWIRSFKTKKTLDSDWVFAGSVLIPDPLDKTKTPFYAANDGDVICVSNFDSAMLDLPINSSKDNDDLQFEAYTERIPPRETPVQVILEPVLKKRAKE
jgi:hypothetical protein